MFKAHSKWSKEDLEWNLWSFCIIFISLLHWKFPRRPFKCFSGQLSQQLNNHWVTKTQFWNLRRKKPRKSLREKHFCSGLNVIFFPPRWICGETMFQDLATFLLYIMPQCSTQARDTKQNPFYLRRVTTATTKCLWNPQEEKILWTCCFFIVSFEWT